MHLASIGYIKINNFFLGSDTTSPLRLVEFLNLALQFLLSDSTSVVLPNF